MDTDRLNRWLTLVANLGVITGIVFLIVELDQANRIARYTAENARRSQFIEINSSFIDNSEVYSKLQATDAELTPSERLQALMMARQLMNTWQDAESAFNYGLLSDRTFEITLDDISIVIGEFPGLIPYIGYLYYAYHHGRVSSAVSIRVAEILACILHE